MPRRQFKLPPTVRVKPPQEELLPPFTSTAFGLMVFSVLYVTQFVPLGLLLACGSYALAMYAKKREPVTKFYGVTVIGAAAVIIISIVIIAVLTILLIGATIGRLIP